MSEVMHTPGEITILLQKASGGDRAAADELYRLVEKDLRAIAGKRKQWFHQNDGSTTVLVDDVFCKLIGNLAKSSQAGDRGKFFSFAATKIHDLLVEAARASQALKRGGDVQKLDVNELDPASPLSSEESDFVLDLKNALDRFEQIAPEDAQAFRIYSFLECTFDETAQLLEVSATEVKRRFKRAQTWLQAELKDYRR